MSSPPLTGQVKYTRIGGLGKSGTVPIASAKMPYGGACALKKHKKSAHVGRNSQKLYYYDILVGQIYRNGARKSPKVNTAGHVLAGTVAGTDARQGPRKMFCIARQSRARDIAPSARWTCRAQRGHGDRIVTSLRRVCAGTGLVASLTCDKLM